MRYLALTGKLHLPLALAKTCALLWRLRVKAARTGHALEILGRMLVIFSNRMTTAVALVVLAFFKVMIH